MGAGAFNLEQCCQENRAALEKLAKAVADIGNQISGAISSAAQVDSGAINEGLGKVVGGLSQLQQTIGGDISNLDSDLVNALARLGQVEKSAIITAASNLQATLGKVASANQQEMAKLIAEIDHDFQALIQALPQELTPLINALTTDFTALTQTLNFAVGGPLRVIAQVLANEAGCICPSIEDVAKAIRAQTASEDVPQPLIDALAKHGTFPPDVSQLVSGAPWATVFAGIIGTLAGDIASENKEDWPALAKMLIGIIKPWADELVKVVGGWAEPAVKYAFDSAREWYKQPEQAVGHLIEVLTTLESTLPKDAFDTLTKLISSVEHVTPDNVEEVWAQLAGAQFTFGQVIHLVAGISSYLGYPMSSMWRDNAKQFVRLMPYRDLSNALRRPFVAAVIGEPSRQRFNKQFRTRVPFPFVGAEMYARRKITEAQFDELLARDGQNPEWVKGLKEIAYRALSEFLVPTLWTNREYPADVVKHILFDARLAPEYVAPVNDALEARTTESLENSFLLELQQAVAEGAAPQSDLDTQMGDLGWGKKAQHLVHMRGILERTRKLIDETIKEWKPQVEAGFATPEQYRTALETAGAEPWKVDLEVGKAEAQLGLKQFKREQQTEHRQALETFRMAVRVAKDRFAKGIIGAPELAAELETARTIYDSGLKLIGWSAENIASELLVASRWTAAAVADAEAKATFRQVFVYGLTLPKEQGELLKLQVSALLEQYRYSQLTLDDLRIQLGALKIPNNFIQAIIAKVEPEPTHVGPPPPPPAV